jgi:hypothetical protein
MQFAGVGSLRFAGVVSHILWRWHRAEQWDIRADRESGDHAPAIRARRRQLAELAALDGMAYLAAVAAGSVVATKERTAAVKVALEAAGDIGLGARFHRWNEGAANGPALPESSGRVSGSSSARLGEEKLLAISDRIAAAIGFYGDVPPGLELGAGADAPALGGSDPDPETEASEED